MGLTEPLHRAVFTSPDKPATINGDRVYSWLEFKDRVAKLASGLKSLGVSKGDRVAILSLNSDRYFEAYYAIWWLGAVVVPMNIRWSAAENIYSLKDGKDVPRGEIGEIWARSPGSMQGYWNKPEQTAETLNNGWVKTGDGARMDEDGFIYIVDRVKDMIITGGENVFSAEVENALSTFPGAVQVAVIGIPDEQWGEAVHAIIVTADGKDLSKEDIISHCREQLANYKLPHSMEFRSEPLPLSGAGKILKRQLREPYWEDASKGVS